MGITTGKRTSGVGLCIARQVTTWSVRYTDQRDVMGGSGRNEVHCDVDQSLSVMADARPDIMTLLT